MTKNVDEIEKMAVDMECNAPRISKDDIDKAIVETKYFYHTMKSGAIGTWCVITLYNGFTVSGEPSWCVSKENFRQQIGDKVAYDNTYGNIWKLLGFRLKEQIYNNAQPLLDLEDSQDVE